MSAVAFCRRAGVPQSSFFAWRKKLRDQAVAGEAGFAEVKVAPVDALVGYQEINGCREAAMAERGGIELRLPRGRCVVVRPGFDRQTLIDLLAVLEGVSDGILVRGGGVDAHGAALRRARS